MHINDTAAQTFQKAMRVSIRSSVLLCISIFSLIHTPTFAIKKSYIVYLGEHSHGSNPTTADQERATNSHHELLGSFVGCKEKAKQSIFYSYNQHINGFAATIEEKEAEELAKHPDVISIFENKIKKTHTTRAWDFLGLEKGSGIPLNSLWKKANFGDGIIIGNIDTGIWPESQSFSDEGMGPVPPRWRGFCQEGVMQDGSSDGLKCNRKLIGLRYFNKGIEEFVRSENITLPYKFMFNTARDLDGHGTTTLSAAGGNFVANVSELGNGYGTAKGGSPKARVAMYKTLWPEFEGTDADVLAAIEAAIYDGVDVISVSLGGPETEYFEDSVTIGAFHAMKHGIALVAAAGNGGPAEATAGNSAPWIFTVGATTIDREFASYVTLGNKKVFKGPSASNVGFPPQKMYPLVTGEDVSVPDTPVEDLRLCQMDQIDADKLTGNILVCIMKQPSKTEGTSSQQATVNYKDISQTGFGIILVNEKENANDTLVTFYPAPSSRLNFTDGESVFDYIKSTKNPVAHISNVIEEFNTKPAPMVALFSSRGPSKVEPNIIKPDITAPGVNIIAACNNPQLPYEAVSGTSIACPIVAGIVGLLKVIHPHWTPSAIKSAIMTTATTKDIYSRPIVDGNEKEATPFDLGSGNLRPDLAADPGLVYDLRVDDYLNFLCAHGYSEKSISMFYTRKPYVCPKSSSLADFNYPSIAVSEINDDPVTVTRRLKNVGKPGTYNVSVEELAGVTTEFEPKSLTFGKLGEEKKFKVVFKRNGNVKVGGYVFGGFTWFDGYHHVRSPIAVKL